jgi:hypothetical protein
MPNQLSITERTNIALDRAYTKSAGKMLAQIKAITNAPGSQLQRSLRELDEEADRLIKDDARMNADNAALQKALNDYERAFVASQTLITGSDNDIQASGQTLAISAVTAKVFLDVTRQIAESGGDPLSPAGLAVYIAQTKRAGVIWNVPTVLNFATNYVESESWIERMEGWGEGYAALTRETILKGIQEGWGPKYTASQLRHLAQNMPVRAAETLTRTLQLTSYRDASAAMEIQNSSYILGKIRVSALQDRSCLACVSLHGSRLELGERIDGHFNCLCSEEYLTIGNPDGPSFMQADSKPGHRNFVTFTTGEEWFNSLSPERQRQQASFVNSPAKWRAFQAGTPISQFVGEHTDPTFGAQIVESSLLGALGENAAQYYTVNQ